MQGLKINKRIFSLSRHLINLIMIMIIMVKIIIITIIILTMINI